MKIEVLVGMIASGKTSYARSRADDGALIISHDDLTEMLHGRYEYYGSLRSCYRQMEEALADIAIRNRCDVVIDRTHLTHESRKRWVDYVSHRRIDFPHRSPVELVAVAFRIEAAKVHALRRFEADPRGRSYEEWLGVAKHHFDQAMLDSMGGDEGFDRVEWKEFADGEVRESTRDRVMSRIDATKEYRDEKEMAKIDKFAKLDARIAEKRLVPVVAMPRPAVAKPRKIKPKPQSISGPIVLKNSFDLGSLRESLTIPSQPVPDTQS